MKSLSLAPLPHAVKTGVAVPGSKSYTNRALLLAALTPGTVRLTGALISDDTEAMISCLQSLGIKIAHKGADLEVIGDIGSIKAKDYELDADLSGITLRFLLALCCVLPGRQTLSGKAGLNKRPVGDLVDALRRLGARIEYLGQEGYPPLRVASSELTGHSVELNGGTSSQYLSALLMIAPLAGGLSVKVTGGLISRPYAHMTIDIMKHFNVNTEVDGNVFRVAAGQHYAASEYRIEGDFSAAAYFFAVAALTASTITVDNLNPRSAQADRAFLAILEKMGSKVTEGTGSVTVAGKDVKPLSIDMRDCPDQAQTLAVLAAFAKGKTVISGIGSLRVKETERIKALEEELAKMGVKTASTKDSLTIHGGNPQPAAINTHGDHRMAMSLAVAGSKLAGMEIRNPEVVNKTFPGFWKELHAVGVDTRAVDSHPNIVLIGMRGSGKTTVARELARRLGIRRLDLDEIMARKLDLSTPEIVGKYGWGYFRDQEAIIAKEMSAMSDTLISTGGGIVLRPENVAALRQNGIVILLKASVDVLVQRLRDSTDRPPLTNQKSLRAEIEQVLRERQRFYEEAADIVIDTDNMLPGQAADAIIAELGRDKK
jgi:3-phosphoshikimate 1-carboxyvinyltransferase